MYKTKQKNCDVQKRKKYISHIKGKGVRINPDFSMEIPKATGSWNNILHNLKEYSYQPG